MVMFIFQNLSSGMPVSSILALRGAGPSCDPETLESTRRETWGPRLGFLLILGGLYFENLWQKRFFTAVDIFFVALGINCMFVGALGTGLTFHSF